MLGRCILDPVVVAVELVGLLVGFVYRRWLLMMTWCYYMRIVCALFNLVAFECLEGFIISPNCSVSGGVGECLKFSICFYFTAINSRAIVILIMRILFLFFRF